VTTTPQRLPLARPTLGDAEQAAQARALASGRLVLGPENLAFEAGLVQATGASGAVAVASGTAALHAALWALDLPPGGEVLVPAFTFPAPAHAVVALGLTPVAVDVDPATWNMSVHAAATRITAKTVAICAVDQFGLLADHHALGELALAHELPLVEDAACALGAHDGHGRRAGSFGDLACFSFHPRKIVTTGEGGAVVGTDDALVDRVRQLRHHGQAGAGSFVRVGLNFRLGEPAAALGVAQLERLEHLVAERRARVRTYLAALAAEPATRHLHAQADHPGRVWQTFALLLPERAPRARVIASLAEAGIEAGAATYALHRIGSLCGVRGVAGHDYPVADVLHDRALALPLFGGMTDDDVARVVAALAHALR
jgi:perosamine synthetase